MHRCTARLSLSRPVSFSLVFIRRQDAFFLRFLHASSARGGIVVLVCPELAAFLFLLHNDSAPRWGG